MKCKSRTVAILSVGIIAGFLFSVALQNFLLVNTLNPAPINGWFTPPAETIKENSKRQRDLDTDWAIPSTTIHQQSSDSDTSTVSSSILTEPSQLNWKARNMQKLNTGNTLPIGRLSEELTLRQPFLIAVITSVDRLLSHTMAIHGTWAKKQKNRVLYFTGDVHSMPHLPHGMQVIQLEGIDDKQASWDLKEFSVIKYLTSHYTEQVDWFLVASDQVFVNMLLLSKRLELYRADVPVYMGQAKHNPPGQEEDEEVAADIRKCNSMTGVVYSRGLLNRMEPYLPQCEGESQSVSDCIVHRGIHCTQAKEVST